MFKHKQRQTNRPAEPRSSQQEEADIRGRDTAPAAVAAAASTQEWYETEKFNPLDILRNSPDLAKQVRTGEEVDEMKRKRQDWAL